MDALVAWLVLWVPYGRVGSVARPLGRVCRRGGVARFRGPVWPPL